MEMNRDIEGLINALDHRDCIVRKEAVIALKRMKDIRALLPLIHTLKYEEWQDKYAIMGSVRENAAEALGLLNDKEAIIPLIEALNDKDEEVRWKAAWALGNIGDKSAVVPLIYALNDDRWTVRRFAVTSLGRIMDERAVDSLIEALDDEDWHVRKYAAEALGNIGDEKALEPLIQSLVDEDRDVRLKAINALGKMGDDAVEPLIYIFVIGDWHLRGVAATVLGNIGNNKALGTLINALVGEEKDRNKYVRGKVAEALGNIGDEMAVEPLKLALKDPYIFVRTKAKKALKKIKSDIKMINFDNGEISFEYPDSWEIMSTTEARKIVIGSFEDNVKFFINRNSELGGLTSEEFREIIDEVFLIQDNKIISKKSEKIDKMDVYKITGDSLQPGSVNRTMIVSFKRDEMMFSLWFSGERNYFSEAEDDMETIIDSFKISNYSSSL